MAKTRGVEGRKWEVGGLGGGRERSRGFPHSRDSLLRLAVAASSKSGIPAELRQVVQLIYDVSSTDLLYIPALMYSAPPSVQIHPYLTDLNQKYWTSSSAATFNFLLCQLVALIGRGLKKTHPLIKI